MFGAKQVGVFLTFSLRTNLKYFYFQCIWKYTIAAEVLVWFHKLNYKLPMHMKATLRTTHVLSRRDLAISGKTQVPETSQPDGSKAAGREKARQQEDSQLQAAVMEFQTGWEMKSCRGSLRVIEGSRGVETETKERSYPNSIDGQHSNSTPMPCKQHKGPGVTCSHIQDLNKSGFPAAVLISSWCRCGCICLLKSRYSSDPSSGGELCQVPYQGPLWLPREGRGYPVQACHL